MNYKVSIRTKLTSYFLTVVFVALIVNVIFITLHIIIVDRYKQIEKSIFLQYRLIGATSDLVSQYNVYRSTTIDSDLDKYLENRKNIKDILSELDIAIRESDSRDLLLGVEKTIESVLNDTDTGVENIKKGDITDTSTRYTEAYRKFSFVQDNVTNLILKEIGYGERLGIQANKVSGYILIFGGTLFIMTLFMLTWLSVIWSRGVVDPLIKLTGVAKSITDGDLDKSVDQELIKRGDEFGILANSFNIMLESLKKNMNVLKESNESISKANESVEKKNSELVEMNKFMINRELKMIELKKKIADLEARVSK